MRLPPYPGYSWPVTQHAAGFKEDVIRLMLECALPFEGEAEVQGRITSLMVSANLLTKNSRDGTDSAWRDYQQLLAELGLIYSTTVERNLRVTDIAKSMVSDDISYKELITTQVLRYQYPNGQKFTVQARLRSEISASPFSASENQIDLHVNSGVLIKPAVLLLRVLYELHKIGHVPELSLAEIGAYLLPSKSNAEWPVCLSEVLSGQRSHVEPAPIAQYAKRNLQDWFKLLGETLLFETNGVTWLRLSSLALAQEERLRELIELGERPENFWIPSGSTAEDRKGWFSWYGDIGVESAAMEAVMPASAAEGAEAATTGKEAPVDVEDEDDTEVRATSLPVILTEVDEALLLRSRTFSISTDEAEIARRVASGAMKRHAKALLHDEIVVRYTRHFRSQGALVENDPNSVDLLVRWGERAALFEVKTVTARNLQTRMRLALGQVEEYAFRIQAEHNINVDKGIIINRNLPEDKWYRDFFAAHMRVGVISVTAAGSASLHPHGCQSCAYW